VVAKDIAPGRRLHRELEALFDHSRIDGPREIKAAADGASGGEELVDGGEVHRLSFRRLLDLALFLF
jgi:hypothetical protein